MRSENRMRMENMFLLALALIVLGLVAINFLVVLPDWVGGLLIAIGALCFIGGVVAT